MTVNLMIELPGNKYQPAKLKIKCIQKLKCYFSVPVLKALCVKFGLTNVSLDKINMLPINGNKSAILAMPLWFFHF